MRFLYRIRRVCCLCLLLAVTVSAALAEGVPEAADRGLDLTETVSVHYPAVIGLADAALQEKVNAQIQQDCRVEEWLARAAMLISGGALRTEWTGGLPGTEKDVFSCGLSAEGSLETPRETHVWAGSSVDLRDGHEIGWDELFTDEGAARTRMETWLETELAPEMSAHLLNSELLPLPESFFLEQTGLRLLYPVRQLSTLSDRAGDIRIPWHLLRETLDLQEDSILRRIGVPEMIILSAESAERLRKDAEEGVLQDIPAKLGDALQPLTDRHHLLTDPDGYKDGSEEGRMFALEGGAFQGIFLLTDDLTAAWDRSAVQGIRAEEGCLYGLCLKETRREAWLETLGEPDFTREISNAQAEGNRMNAVRCDGYNCGEHTLKLYSDEAGVLVSLILAE